MPSNFKCCKIHKTGSIRIEANVELDCKQDSKEYLKSKLYNKSHLINEKRTSTMSKSTEKPRNYSTLLTKSEISQDFKPCKEKLLNYLVISISDSGCGMSSDKLLHFNNAMTASEIKLSRIKNFNESSGLGMGLNIVKIILKKLNIKYSIGSRLNIGSKFKIYFPLIISEELESKPSNEKNYFDVDNSININKNTKRNRNNSDTKFLSLNHLQISFQFPIYTQNDVSSNSSANTNLNKKLDISQSELAKKNNL